MMTNWACGTWFSSCSSQGTSLWFGVGRMMSEITMDTVSVAFTRSFRGSVPMGLRSAAKTAPASSARASRCFGSMTWASSGTGSSRPSFP